MVLPEERTFNFFPGRWRRARRRRDAEHEALIESLSGMQEGMLIIERGRLVTVNPVVADLLGWTEAEMLSWSSFLDIFHPDERDRIAANYHRRLAGEAFQSRYESALRRRSGERCEVDMAAARLRIGDSSRIVVIFRDITEQKSARQQLEAANQRLLAEIRQRQAAEALLREQALHDSLTGLLNRMGLMGRLERALAEARRHGKRMGLLFLDLDDFKEVNDSLGHKAGDQLLQAFAQRLSGVARGTDTVARLAGDEFVILLEGIADGPAGLASAADKIIATMATPFVFETREVLLTTSIGATLYRDGDTLPDHLLDRADGAMYQAKGGGRNTYRIAPCN